MDEYGYALLEKVAKLVCIVSGSGSDVPVCSSVLHSLHVIEEARSRTYVGLGLAYCVVRLAADLHAEVVIGVLFESSIRVGKVAE